MCNSKPKKVEEFWARYREMLSKHAGNVEQQLIKVEVLTEEETDGSYFECFLEENIQNRKNNIKDADKLWCEIEKELEKNASSLSRHEKVEYDVLLHIVSEYIGDMNYSILIFSKLLSKLREQRDLDTNNN